MRAVWRAFLGALLMVGLALSASAPAAAQNGLERFEKDIKPQLELKKFTYASGRALGDKGFVLNDVVAVVPASEATGDKESTVKIDKLTVEELDFERLKKDTKDGKFSQCVSNTLDMKLRDDLERLKKIRAHRGLRHYWGLRVRGQKTKTTGRKGRTVGVSKKKG